MKAIDNQPHYKPFYKYASTTTVTTTHLKLHPMNIEKRSLMLIWEKYFFSK
jgi:hypothetical protein